MKWFIPWNFSYNKRWLEPIRAGFHCNISEYCWTREQVEDLFHVFNQDIIWQKLFLRIELIACQKRSNLNGTIPWKEPFLKGRVNCNSALNTFWFNFSFITILSLLMNLVLGISAELVLWHKSSICTNNFWRERKVCFQLHMKYVLGHPTDVIALPIFRKLFWLRKLHFCQLLENTVCLLADC